MGCDILGVSSWVSQAGVPRLGAVGGVVTRVHAFLPPSAPDVPVPHPRGAGVGDRGDWGQTPKLHHQIDV